MGQGKIYLILTLTLVMLKKYIINSPEIPVKACQMRVIKKDEVCIQRISEYLIVMSRQGRDTTKREDRHIRLGIYSRIRWSISNSPEKIKPKSYLSRDLEFDQYWYGGLAGNDGPAIIEKVLKFRGPSWTPRIWNEKFAIAGKRLPDQRYSLRN